MDDSEDSSLELVLVTKTDKLRLDFKEQELTEVAERGNQLQLDQEQQERAWFGRGKK